MTGVALVDPRTLFDLTGQVALITGGAGGLGSGMAAALAGAGAAIVLADSDAGRLDGAARSLAGGQGGVLALAGDVTDPAFAAAALQATLDRFGRIDILVCAAGRPLRKGALASSDAEYDELMAVNLKAVFQWNRTIGAWMTEHRRGCIVNVASQGAFAVLRNRPLYNTSKAGVVHLTRSLAMDWIGFNVRVNAIAPGLMDTPFIAEMKADADRIQAEQAKIPAGRLGRPGDLAGAVLLLASDAGCYIVGQTLIVDGGWTLG
jgi:NAD(P)-dependent dehydrogenase (short-subunit alcohol dehydrogenase family)